MDWVIDLMREMREKDEQARIVIYWDKTRMNKF